jgi:hypothetical protein
MRDSRRGKTPRKSCTEQALDASGFVIYNSRVMNVAGELHNSASTAGSRYYFFSLL